MMKIERFYNEVSETIQQLHDCDGKNFNIKHFKKGEGKTILIKSEVYSHNGRVVYINGIGWVSIKRDDETNKMFVAIIVNFPARKK